ncbi:NUDIX domain-containing protein [Micromonospora sp. NPDC049751]|uniref:NUDIX hydrolase n=1 Tax=Micromonospora sp. NPDC049751 TaxID=3154837 RepID=UPI0033EFBAE7
MESVRRVGSYGLLGDLGRFLVVRDSGARAWSLPGGLVAHAEHPERAVVRAFTEQTGSSASVGRLRAVVADVNADAGGGTSVHTDRLLFDLAARDGVPEVTGGGVQTRWVDPGAVAELPLMPFSAELLGLPAVSLPVDAYPSAEPPAPTHPDRRLRFGAYGLVTDPAGRILLTQIADGYPGAGKWHLPGGGTDHGEQPTTGLLRELVEEGGQVGRVLELLGVDNLHNPAALGPEGRPLDWHGVRVVYRVLVDAPTDAVVTESAGGSTARAGWFTVAQTAELPLTGIAASAIGQLAA